MKDNDSYLSAQIIIGEVEHCKNEEFVDGMSRQHRTHQQMFTAKCLAWIEHLSKLEENQYDLRNQASVDISKKIVERYNAGEKYPDEFQYTKNLSCV